MCFFFLTGCYFLFLFFNFIFFISWRLITLQYCSGFCHTLTCMCYVCFHCTAKWINYIYIHIYTYIYMYIYVYIYSGFPDGSDCNEFACKSGDLCSVSELGRFPGEVNVYPLQYFCLENSMDREAWQATFHGVAKKLIMTVWLTFSRFFKYIYSLWAGDSFPIQVITEHWIEFPVMHSWSLLAIYFIYSSVHLSTPISPFILFLTTRFLPGISLFSTSVILYLFCE